jgi:peroxidase
VSRPLSRTAIAVCLIGLVAMALQADVAGGRSGGRPPLSFAVRTLDGSGNNRAHHDWGRVHTPFVRVGRPNYADGLTEMPDGPPPRYISNRIFNDVGQNLFSENGVTQWGWAWGQFIDHDLDLRDETPLEIAPLAFNPRDPLETFRNDLLNIAVWRTPAAPGTGITTPRQQLNLLSSYIDGSNVYGVSAARLDWLRVGRVDGKPADNGARLLVTRDGYLPRADARGAPSTAPPMELDGALAATPAKAAVAGDMRADENIALTAIQTLFARDHNRVVDLLPRTLTAELKFQIARRIVGAEEQYVTYTEFLPALGVRIGPYHGYDRTLNAGVSNEFAAVGYRAHSMIHASFDATEPVGTWPADQLESFGRAGIGVEPHDGLVSLAIPLTVAFGNPDLLESVGLGPILRSLAAEREYRNDEQIDNALRSVLFQVPKPGVRDPGVCGQSVISPDCFRGVQDLGAIDVQRARDHGMPTYNAMRQAYGLEPKRTFADVTGEAGGPDGDLGSPINDPSSLDFVSLLDRDGRPIPLGSAEAARDAVTGVRRTTLASRLRAIYGEVDRLDAFVGMVSEQHIPGAEFGELQLAMWKRQFERLRDGDRFFYLNDPVLVEIGHRYRISYRHTLADLIRLNTGAAVQRDVFELPPG